MSYCRHIADDNPEVPATERRDCAPAELRQWSRAVSLHEFSYEQTRIVRDATEMVVRLTRNGEDRREKIDSVVFRIAKELSFDAALLANLTLADMAQTARKTG
jgi:hypothetical protein